MKTNTKFILLAIIAIIFCLGLTSCADYDNNLIDLRDNSQPTFVQNSKKMITFRGKS